MTGVTLAYAGSGIAVDADPAAVEWLVEFLGPAFAVTDASGPTPGPLVRFGAEPELHARLRARLGAAPPRRVDGFTLDGSFSRNPAFDDDGCRWIHDPSHDTFFGVSQGGRRIEVVAPDGDPYHRLELMRAVRELATVGAHRAGQLPVHASAFVLEGGAVLVCGRKRAGKTSVLVHALERGATFLSNDRVWVSIEEPRAHAMPTIVMLRDGTLEHFDGLRRAFEGARFDRARTLAECAPGVPRPVPRPGPGFDRPGISPAQLCRLLDAASVGEAPVRALLFPRVDERVRGAHLTPLPAESAGELLGESLLKPSHPTRLSEAFAPDARDEVPPEVEAARRRRLAQAVPAWTCRLGPDAYERDLPAALRRLAAGPRAEGSALRVPS